MESWGVAQVRGRTEGSPPPDGPLAALAWFPESGGWDLLLEEAKWAASFVPWIAWAHVRHLELLAGKEERIRRLLDEVSGGRLSFFTKNAPELIYLYARVLGDFGIAEALAERHGAGRGRTSWDPMMDLGLAALDRGAASHRDPR